MKPKSNRKGNANKQHNINACQTPDYALDPLLPYLPPHWTIWEPAAGEGYLTYALLKAGIQSVITSDILDGRDFLKYQPDEDWQALITNPPYAPKEIKPAWIKRCYDLGKPWACLMPVETIGSGEVQALFDDHGIEIIYLDKRVNFKMPFKGWGGKAQFPVCWYTWGLNIGRAMTFAAIHRREQDQPLLFEYVDMQPALFEVAS